MIKICVCEDDIPVVYYWSVLVPILKGQDMKVLRESICDDVIFPKFLCSVKLCGYVYMYIGLCTLNQALLPECCCHN